MKTCAQQSSQERRAEEPHTLLTYNDFPKPWKSNGKPEILARALQEVHSCRGPMNHFLLNGVARALKPKAHLMTGCGHVGNTAGLPSGLKNYGQ